ncbi:MAG: PEP-CTERM sorting domain-containing protein [Planctomycetes bacterium]|nr:PEP-CTERM sorting domain-containing protein [Planctomycetota bacterium]
MRILHCAVYIGLLLGMSGSALAEPPSFIPLGDLPGGGFMSGAGAVSADGSIVAGASCSYTMNDFCYSEAFVWQGGTMSPLGFPPDWNPIPFSGIQAMSADGAMLAGSARSEEGTNEPFRWENGVFTSLGRIPGYGTNAHLTNGMSDDGQRIVGWGYSASGELAQAWLWENGSMTGLGTLSGQPGSSSSASGISGDGSVIVGGSDGQAFRWVDGVMTGIGFLPPPFPGEDVSLASYAAAASYDGSIIVGGSSAYDYSTDQSQGQAFRWSDGAMIGLGDLPGGDFASSATAVSADGSIIVGQGTASTGEVAFIWDQSHGMRDLRELLVGDFGLDLTGWTLRYVSDISADGRVIVGTGINPAGDNEAFRAVVPEPGSVTLLCFASCLILIRRTR